MRLVLVSAGTLPVPPIGWGALETVVWNLYLSLQKLGVDVHIVNEESTDETYKKIVELDPDVVHLHYGAHYEMMPLLKCKKIATSHDGSFLECLRGHDTMIRSYLYDCKFFCLTSWERKFLTNHIGIANDDVVIVPNGVAGFTHKKDPLYPEYSICLGKIDVRKNQGWLQKMNLPIFFVGGEGDDSFDYSLPDYLGEWTKEEVKNNLTDYANLVLLSKGELQPLVCLEALASGLGLVITEECAQNLDTSKEFISIVKLTDSREHIRSVIEKNAAYSLKHRDEIVEYASMFAWDRIAEKYINSL